MHCSSIKLVLYCRRMQCTCIVLHLHENNIYADNFIEFLKIIFCTYILILIVKTIEMLCSEQQYHCTLSSWAALVLGIPSAKAYNDDYYYCNIVFRGLLDD